STLGQQRELVFNWSEFGHSYPEYKEAMPDRVRKPEKTTPHKDKICQTCGRAFSWRRKWEKDWDVVKYCSDACRGNKPGEADAALEAAILDLLAARGRDKTICPSEAARLVGGNET